MSLEQKKESTKGAVVELEAQREERNTSIQNIPINAFHDARANLMSIGRQVWFYC